MNGVHDMGGMICFGPVEREEQEPVFHDEWERRVLALTIATSGLFGRLDKRRHVLEKLDPVEYLSCTYYERWLARLERSADQEGLSRKTSVAKEPANPISTGALESVIRGGRPASRTTGRQEPRFSVGDPVRARKLNPPGQIPWIQTRIHFSGKPWLVRKFLLIPEVLLPIRNFLNHQLKGKRCSPL